MVRISKTFVIAGSIAQILVLITSGMLGYYHQPAWWLIPLTLLMAVIAWLTDRHWNIRFYDIYGWRDWLKFWAETLGGLFCFVFLAFAAGYVIKNVTDAIMRT